jgi:protein SMG7
MFRITRRGRRKRLTKSRLRLTCMATIFLDFEYAVSQAAEDVLWNLHLSINAEYRRVLGTLKQNSHAVERRKVENKYNNFLRIAQQFYKGYIQRLSQRYDIKELRRIAHGMDVAHKKPADAIDNVPADLQVKLLMSCHSTLIRLGDLARYRIQARHKKSGYDTALTYYGLANNLVPHSGYGFHQMAIVNSDEGNHLDVVYHFYRALAVKEPHPMAQQNLEAKFKGLQSSKGPQSSNTSSSRGKKGQPSDEDHLITWFVRLHALFYRGDIFSSQHNEMETEAVHRIEWSVTESGQLQNLLKMSLVNMAAYTVACEKYDSE